MGKVWTRKGWRKRQRWKVSRVCTGAVVQWTAIRWWTSSCWGYVWSSAQSAKASALKRKGERLGDHMWMNWAGVGECCSVVANKAFAALGVGYLIEWILWEVNAVCKLSAVGKKERFLKFLESESWCTSLHLGLGILGGSNVENRSHGDDPATPSSNSSPPRNNTADTTQGLSVS